MKYRAPYGAYSNGGKGQNLFVVVVFFVVFSLCKAIFDDHH